MHVLKLMIDRAGFARLVDVNCVDDFVYKLAKPLPYRLHWRHEAACHLKHRGSSA